MGPDAKSLIERARRDGPSSVQREEMRRSVKAALAGGLAVGGTSTAAAAHLGASAAVHGFGASLTPLGLLGWLGAGSVVGGLALGGAVLVTGTYGAPSRQPRAVSTPVPSAIAERRPAGNPGPTAVVGSTSDPSAPPEPAAARERLAHERTLRAEAAPAPQVAEIDSLHAEYALLESAHRALEQGDTEAALLRLDEHQRQFGDGRLKEERQGTQTLALCVGQRQGARAQAIRFLGAYPHSLLGPRIRQQCHLK